MNEERIEQFGNFFFIGKVQGTFEGNPALVNITLISFEYG